jgi:hypothetical protein
MIATAIKASLFGIPIRKILALELADGWFALVTRDALIEFFVVLVVSRPEFLDLDSPRNRL